MNEGRPDGANTEQKEREALILDLIRERVQREWGRLDGLDNKANQTGTIATVVLAFLVSVLTLEHQSLQGAEVLSKILLYLGLGLLILSLLFALLAMRIRRWPDAPNPQALIDYYGDSPVSEVTQVVASNLADVAMRVSTKNDSKGVLVEYSWSSLIAGIIVAALFAGLLIV